MQTRKDVLGAGAAAGGVAVAASFVGAKTFGVASGGAAAAVVAIVAVDEREIGTLGRVPESDQILEVEEVESSCSWA